MEDIHPLGTPVVPDVYTIRDIRLLFLGGAEWRTGIPAKSRKQTENMSRRLAVVVVVVVVERSSELKMRSNLPRTSSSWCA